MAKKKAAKKTTKKSPKKPATQAGKQSSLSKKTAPAKNNQKSQPATTAAGGTGYCEYHCSNGDWWPANAMPEPGYYCPDYPFREQENLGCTEGTTTIIPAVEIPSRKAKSGASISDGSHCVYQVKRGNFYFVDAVCEAGHFCPADLFEFATSSGHGKLGRLVRALRDLGDDVEATISVSSALIAQCRSKGHTPRKHRGAK
ncbi:MAG: hypothetical protein R3E01_19415 [Pirellulaceae bacterium]|nr:hypothetical protein [Planctomycetales bacterium]